MLNPDYRDILSVFESAKVEYLLVGAYAMAVHGQPRATGDIDLWVRSSPENADRVFEALREFGAPMSDVVPEDFVASDTVLQIGVTPRRIDILTSIDGIAFEDAWHGRMVSEIEGIAISVISREHLIQNKRTLGRKQDLADIEKLEAGS
jgi:hypothetical protein